MSTGTSHFGFGPMLVPKSVQGLLVLVIIGFLIQYWRTNRRRAAHVVMYLMMTKHFSIISRMRVHEAMHVIKDREAAANFYFGP